MSNRLGRAMLLVILIVLIGVQPSWAAMQDSSPESILQQESPDDFFIQASGMVTTDNALRYTIYIPKPLPDVANYVVQVEIPSNASINQVLHGGGSTFAGIVSETTTEAPGQQLVWTVANEPSPNAMPDSSSTTLSFVLAQPIDKPLVVTLDWVGESSGTLQKAIIPRYSYNFSNVGQIVLGQDAPVGFQRIGATGILIRAASGVAGSTTTTITARALPPEANPPAEMGDYWWCSVLELSEIAEGETVIVQMPLRRPLSPGTPVVLFQRQADGSWLPLENPGIVTFDGQAVEYEHPGGVVATGVESSLQPQFAELTTLTRQALDVLLASNGQGSPVASVPPQRFVELPSYIQTAFAAAENLASLPAEFTAANPDNAYTVRCGVAANGASICTYWVDVNLCTVSVNALPDVEAVPNVTCSNSPPPEGYNSACVMGEGAC